MNPIDHYYAKRVVWTLIALAFVFFGLCALSAQAQTVAQWETLNESCRGEPDMIRTGKPNPDCRKRQAVMHALIKQGWLPARHEVWVSPEQQTWFAQVLRRYDEQTRENLYAVDSLMPAMLIDLRRKLPDTQIFAIWNEQRPAIQAYAPFGAALMTSMMQKLAMTYARKSDPRYFLEQ